MLLIAIRVITTKGKSDEIELLAAPLRKPTLGRKEIELHTLATVTPALSPPLLPSFFF